MNRNKSRQAALPDCRNAARTSGRGSARSDSGRSIGGGAEIRPKNGAVLSIDLAMQRARA